MPESIRWVLGHGFRILGGVLIIGILWCILTILFSWFFLLAPIALLFAIPIFVLIFVKTYQLDRQYNPWFGPRKLTATETEKLNMGTFRLAGYVARGEGRVNEEQIAKVTKYLDLITSDSNYRKLLIEEFNIGKQDNFDPAATCTEIVQAVHNSKVFKHRLVDFLIGVIFSGGAIQSGCYSRLATVTTGLKMPVYLMERMVREAQAIYQFQNFFKSAGSANYGSYGDGSYNSRARSYVPHDDIANAYKVIGVPENSSFDEVKKAYHRLMRKYHPDRLASQGLSPEMIKVYTEKAQTIQQAYDLLKQQLEHKEA